MSEPTALTEPVPAPGTLAPDVRKQTVAALASPWWQSPTVGAFFVALLLELPNLIDLLIPILSAKQASTFHALAVFAAAAAGIFARQAGLAAGATAIDRSDAKLEEVAGRREQR